MEDRTDKEERVEGGKATDRSSRRKLLKAGVYLVPAIVTLRARAAFGAPGETPGEPIRDLNRNYQTNTYQFEYGTENNKGKTTFQVHGIDPPVEWDPVNYPDVYRSSDGTFYTWSTP